jgi:hypothetical protein
VKPVSPPCAETNDDDPIANVRASALPRMNERMDLLLASGEGTPTDAPTCP